MSTPAGPGPIAEAAPGRPASPLAPRAGHHLPVDLSDRIALVLTRGLRRFADTLFAGRYGHRAVVLETIAAVPGMVGGTLQHLRALRLVAGEPGRSAWIRTLLDEAENERMHLMSFVHVTRPSAFERLLIVLAQGAFYNLFFLLYLISAKTAHRLVGYFEEEAVISYTEYLAGVDAGSHANVAAPAIAIEYWQLAPDARLRELIVAVRGDEMQHRDVNHAYADALK